MLWRSVALLAVALTVVARGGQGGDDQAVVGAPESIDAADGGQLGAVGIWPENRSGCIVRWASSPRE